MRLLGPGVELKSQLSPPASNGKPIHALLSHLFSSLCERCRHHAKEDRQQADIVQLGYASRDNPYEGRLRGGACH